MTNDKNKNEFIELFKNDPKNISDLLKLFGDTFGQEKLNQLFNKSINEDDYKRKIERNALTIKIPKLLINTNIPELRNLGDTLNEFNACYFNGLLLALALLSRKMIIDVTHAIPIIDKLSDDKLQEINSLRGRSFNTYIDWLSNNRYLTPRCEKLLRMMKEESNLVHHGKANTEDIKKDAKNYYEIIKIFIESNFETTKYSFIEKNNEIKQSNKLED